MHTNDDSLRLVVLELNLVDHGKLDAEQPRPYLLATADDGMVVHRRTS